MAAAVDQVYDRSIVWKNSRRCRAHTDAELPHPPHEFRDFANLLASDSAAELSMWLAVSLWERNLSQSCRSVPSPPSGLPAFHMRVLRVGTNISAVIQTAYSDTKFEKLSGLPAFHACPPFKLVRLSSVYSSRRFCRYHPEPDSMSLDQLDRAVFSSWTRPVCLPITRRVYGQMTVPDPSVPVCHFSVRQPHVFVIVFLRDSWIFTKDRGQRYVDAVEWPRPCL